MNTQTPIVLGFWAIRGIAQPIRFLLNYLGLEFEDRRYTNRDDWFLKDKPVFAANTKLANLPFLSIGTETVFFSDAIYYAIAAHVNRPELVGKDLPTQVKVAVARSIQQDIFKTIIDLVYDKVNYETKKADSMKIISSKFALIDEILEKSKWLAGNELTYVDFILFDYVDEIKEIDLATFQQYKSIESFHTRFLEVPQNKQYTERADYIFKPFYNTQTGSVI